MLLHSARVSGKAGEQTKRLDRLEHGHAAAIQTPASRGTSRAQQFGLEREVDDLGDPVRRPQQIGRYIGTPG